MKLKTRALFAGTIAAFLAVAALAALPNSKSAEAASRPSCTITSNPAVATGGTVKLFYEVQDSPTSISIRADDGAADPSGTPTVGSPDTSRSDTPATGSIDSGPIKKDTVFTMTVSNSRGSGKCSVDVRYNERPSAGWKVPLVKQEPVFSRLQIPGGFDTSVGDYPFHTAYWVPGGYFVVNGPGNSGAGLGQAPAHLQTAANKFEAGGMYGFREDGAFLGARDVIFDTSNRAFACFEGGGCTAQDIISPVSPGKFVRDMEVRSSGFVHFVRSPVVYSITPSGFAMDKRLFFNDRGIDNGSLQTDPEGRLEVFGHVAVSGGRIIGVSSRKAGYVSGRQQSAFANEIYDTNFNRLASFSAPWSSNARNFSGIPPTTAPLFYPIVGVGDYIVGAAGPSSYTGSAFPPFTVYKMPSSEELGRGVAPSNVQTILGNAYMLGYALDTANSNRIGFLTLPKGKAIGSVDPTLTIFEAGSSGMTEVSSRNLELDSREVARLSGNSAATSFTISGEYVAYGACPREAKWNGGRGGNKSDGCQLVVEKISGERLSVEPLPISRYSNFDDRLGTLVGESQAIGAIAMSPTGRIMVTTGSGPGSGGGDNGNIYLYQIDGVQSAPAGPPGPNPPGSPPIPTPTSTGQYAGQTFNITYSTSSAATAPDVLIRISRVISVGSTSLNVGIFGQTYTVDVSKAEILGVNWTPVPLSSFLPGRFANVWGTLDPVDSSIIRAVRIRNPVAGNSPASSQAALAGNGSTFVPSPATAASTQSQLNALQQALKALQLRLKQ